MDTFELFSRFAVALGVGLLFGLERGWKQREDTPGSRTAGIRTFGLVGLLGGIVGALAQAAGLAGAGGFVLGVSFAAFVLVFALFCREENRAEGVFSATTAVAGMVAFALGTYAQWGDLRVVAAVSVAAVVVLASREALHGWVGALTWEELRAGLVLLVMTFVALPLLPDAPVGPFGGVNPRAIWLIAIVLAAVSFVGYAAVKYFGARRGILLAAAAGGLVSSTAVMAAHARRAAGGEGTPRLLAAGAALASGISLLRVLVLVAALNPALLPWAAGPLLAAAATTIGLACVLIFTGPEDAAAGSLPHFRNPFELRAVLLFAAFLGAMIVVGRVASERFGAAGALVAAMAAGLADVDAVTVSMARLAPETLGPAEAAGAILAATASNMVAKLALGMTAGRGAFALWALAATAAAFLAAGAALLLTPALLGASS
ncbi:MAG: MgtC/SapB family protein [Variibacter sp.]|nr:MgtC/SapB family protein [Variibacter sp.]